MSWGRVTAAIGMVAKKVVNAVAWPFVEAASNRALFAGIVVITVVWLLQSDLSRHPWDDLRAGAPKLVLAYTIWFGLVEGAMKVVQADQVRREAVRKAEEEGRQRLMQSQVEHTAELTVAIREELDRSRERDEATQDVLERILDAIEEPEGGDATNGHV